MMNWMLIIVAVLLVMSAVVFGVIKKRIKMTYWLRIVAVGGLVLVLCGSLLSRVGIAEEQDASNRDVIFLTDFTYSMNALDGRDGDSRLQNMRDDILSVAKINQGARYGISSIDTAPNTYLPMTNTYSDLDVAIQTVESADEYSSHGSVWPKISEAMDRLRSYIHNLRKIDNGREIMVVVMSDFEIAQGSDDSLSKIQKAAGALATEVGGAVVIGYGGDAETDMPSINYDYEKNEYNIDTSQSFSGQSGDNPDYRVMLTARNQNNGREIASALGGVYVSAEKTGEIDVAVRDQAKKAYQNQQKSSQTMQLRQGMLYVVPAAVLFAWIALVEIGQMYGAVRMLGRRSND